MILIFHDSVLDDDPIIEISAFERICLDENAKTAEDFDTANAILKSKAGVLIHINNSRRAVDNMRST